MLQWWMRVVGGFYLLKFVAVALVQGPIRAQAPGAISSLAAGDPVAGFLADTWVIFGLEMAALGIALILASRTPHRARALTMAIVGVEISGTIADAYQIWRGYDWSIPMTWMAIHGVIVMVALVSLWRSRDAWSGSSASTA